MLTAIHPKLPMRDKIITKNYYVDQLGFEECGDYGDYLILQKDGIEIHFFEFKALDPKENYGQVYVRTDEIDSLYQSLVNKKVILEILSILLLKIIFLTILNYFLINLLQLIIIKSLV